MKKTPPPLPTLPPLSLQALDEVRGVEDAIQDALQDCDDNLERIRQTLHTGVAEKLNVLWDYYFSLPDPQVDWFAQLIPRTVDSIIGLTPFARGEQFRSELLRMAAHHLPQRLEANKNKAAAAAPAKPSLAPSEETIAAQLKRLRAECNWTIPALAEAVNLDVKTVARNLSGQSIPYARNISAYERAFSKQLKRQILINKMP